MVVVVACAYRLWCLLSGATILHVSTLLPGHLTPNTWPVGLWIPIWSCGLQTAKQSIWSSRVS